MKQILIFIALFSFAEFYGQILNVESLRIKTDTLGWAGKVGLDFSLTKNTKSLVMFGNKTHVQYKTKKSLFLLLEQYNLMISDKNHLIDKSVIHFRYNYKFADRIVGELFLQGQQNSVSKIDFRGLSGVGVRFKLSKSQNMRYYIGTGLMYEYEKDFVNTTATKLMRSTSYFSFSIYPSNQVSMVSTTYFQPALSHFSDYRLSSQNSLFFHLTDKLSFKTSFNLAFDTMPIVGVPELQYNLSSGLVYAF